MCLFIYIYMCVCVYIRTCIYICISIHLYIYEATVASLRSQLEVSVRCKFVFGLHTISTRRARDSRAPVKGGADGCDARALSASPTAVKSLHINELP